MSQFSSDELFRLDEIDRLRAELDEVYEANGKLAYLASQNDRLRAENDDLKAALDVWNSSELGVMIAKLRLALLPYAERAIESEDGGKIARAALNEETK